MASIYTRKAVSAIVGDEGLTAEEKTERLFSLYGQALDDGYVSKSAAAAAQNSAIEQAKADALKDFEAPDPTQSDEYKKLLGERDMLRAIGGKEFSAVKPKFREQVYGMLDRSEGAKSIEEQLKAIGEEYEEYLEPGQQQGGKDGGGDDNPPPKNTPQYSQAPGRAGVNPSSEEDKLFAKLSEGWK